MKTILFLCTGNYYRSRFAEYLFNALAAKQGLNWRASSRGLALERGVYNVGAISQYAVVGLTQRGVSIGNDIRYPLPATMEDFATASNIIAIDELEHRPLIVERFPEWTDVIEYWLVHDIGDTLPDVALATLEQNIQQLIAGMAAMNAEF